ncbi:MAG: hypothetical protein Q7O66_09820 [Dehalococcoidia bacterium]|nr:hypothetical protein [Dehalococcoidia bacterium]
MVKWEYLEIGEGGRSGHFCDKLYIRTRDIKATAEHLRSALHASWELHTTENGSIETNLYNFNVHLLNALGEIGWELAGLETSSTHSTKLVFKRPREG